MMTDEKRKLRDARMDRATLVLSFALLSFAFSAWVFVAIMR